jgi:chromosome segregation ATPase
MITFLILLGIGVAGGYILNNVIPGKNPPTPPATSTQACQTEDDDENEKVMLLEAQIKDKDVQIATLTSQLSDTFKTQQEAISTAYLEHERKLNDIVRTYEYKLSEITRVPLKVKETLTKTEKALDEQQNVIKGLKNIIDRQKTELAALMEKIDSYEKHISNISLARKKLLTELAQQKGDVASKNEIISKLERNYADLQQNYSRLLQNHKELGFLKDERESLVAELKRYKDLQDDVIIAARAKIDNLTNELFIANNSNDKLLIADLKEELECLNKVLLQYQRVVKQMHFLYLEAKQFEHSPEEIATWVEPLLLDLFELVSF